MKIIIDDSNNYMLLARSGHKAIQDGIKPGDLWGYSYEDGTVVSVKCNKNSVRVRI